MKNFYDGIVRFLKGEEGVTAIEYGLIASLVAVAIIVGAGLLGTSLNELFTNVAACLGGGGGGTCPTPK